MQNFYVGKNPAAAVFCIARPVKVSEYLIKMRGINELDVFYAHE